MANKNRITPRPKGRLGRRDEAKPSHEDQAMVKLNSEQSLAIKLMSAREVIKSKNVFIARLQQRHSGRAQLDAQRIAELEAEVTELTNQLMQALINAEQAENGTLATKYALPSGTVNYQLGEDGNFFYTKAAGPSPAPAAPAQDARGEVLTPEERRSALLAELAELESESQDLKVVEGGKKQPDAEANKA